MAEILTPKTPMPALELNHKAPIEINTVYVIPPDRTSSYTARLRYPASQVGRHFCAGIASLDPFVARAIFFKLLCALVNLL